MCDGERGSGPEGADDLCLVSFERQGHNMSLEGVIRALSCDLSLKAMI